MVTNKKIILINWFNPNKYKNLKDLFVSLNYPLLEKVVVDTITSIISYWNKEVTSNQNNDILNEDYWDPNLC